MAEAGPEKAVVATRRAADADMMVNVVCVNASLSFAAMPHDLAQSQHTLTVALTRAQDAAAELELSCDPSLTLLED